MNFLSNSDTPIEHCFLALRPGYIGLRSVTFSNRMDNWFGKGSWFVGYPLGDEIVSHATALELCKDSDKQYSKQASQKEGLAIASVNERIAKFPKQRRISDLTELALPKSISGNAPFIRSECILEDRVVGGDWTSPGSIDDFWQNNRFILLKKSDTLIERLSSEVGDSIKYSLARDFRPASAKLAALIAMGSASSEMVKTFCSALHELYDPSRDRDLSTFHDFWLQDVICNLSRLFETKYLDEDQAVLRCSSIIPAIERAADHITTANVSTITSARFNAALFRALANNASVLHHNGRYLIWLLLQSEGVFEALENPINGPAYLKTIKNAAIANKPLEGFSGFLGPYLWDRISIESKRQIARIFQSRDQ